MTPGPSRAGLFYLTAAAILLGTAWPLTRYALLHGAGASWFALGRAGFSAVVATVLLLARGRLKLPKRRDLPTLLAVGLLQIAGFFALAHAALIWVPAGRTALLSNATIVFTVPLSIMVSERISARRWVATGLGLAGIAVLTGPWSIDWGAPHLLVSHAELLGAALSWSLAMLVVRRYPPRSAMLDLLPWSFALATLALLPLTLEHGPGTWPIQAVIPMMLVGLVIAPAGTWCIMQAQSMLPMVVASIGFMAGPVIGVVLASAFLHEPLGLDILLGAGLILSAAGVAATEGRAR